MANCNRLIYLILYVINSDFLYTIRYGSCGGKHHLRRFLFAREYYHVDRSLITSTKHFVLFPLGVRIVIIISYFIYFFINFL